MEITCFDDLLRAAHAQPEPQRLLFVFTGVELPDDATAEQRTAFAAGHGGALVPRMCVDKLPAEIASFDALAQESQQFGQEWVIVFVAAMSGTLNHVPTSEEAEKPLQHMVEAIKQGMLGSFIPFNRQGEPVHFG
ncbi:MAG: ribonucleotide reductase subunit alpha, partial [Giesbergeria sp.]|jgi:hypothetical protein|nr:ribonucleotide reductase subunit alpha [Giesbergeria sp.]MDQ1258715.1 hypothetical protein [Pseudomonadota bacterium]